MASFPLFVAAFRATPSNIGARSSDCTSLGEKERFGPDFLVGDDDDNVDDSSEAEKWTFD
eukprot:CAMPEP_0178684276 /NCGR_PEP_ID=MMETSP0699-20121125/2748_1 /TAXON_ID=265572 /ORGANISM="Extubocellulus spinifer, Strain CCMP396" /LENGTH=59 /DNA_ID=CAMNT_0020328921 /DNA_START=173 /DNA_END=352 /DNA_ORIENTATION=-